ncbi:MAG: hypothetical protein CME61_03775 [Halobacteriovoraceae bacterium]|nr:hypothetical protein [Halobacteriovoraceae bacterium]
MKNIILLFLFSISLQAFSSIESLEKDTEGLNLLKEKINESVESLDANLDELGNYKLKRIGKKFVTVFTNDNKPIAIFDLSLNALSWKEIVLGAFKIKDFNLKGTLKKIYCSRKIIKQNAKLESGKKAKLGRCSSDKITAGNLDWNKMRMSSTWAERQNQDVLFSDGGYEFFHSDFNLSELVFENEEDKNFFYAPYLELFKIMNPGSEKVTEIQLKNFMSEFEFRLSKDSAEYTMVWNREKRERKEKVKLPGVLVNYISPISPYAYRAKLLRIDSYADLVKYRWFPYGPIMAAMIFRVVDKLIDRVNYHESQLIGLLEAQQTFEYDTGLPHSYVNSTLSLLYLPRSRPSHFGSGNDYRKRYRSFLDSNRKKIIKKMNKKNKDNTTLVAGKKFIIERKFNEETGKDELKSIISTSNKPMWFTGLLSRHVSSLPNGIKSIERLFINTAGYLAKAFLRTWVGFSLGPVNFVIQVPRDFWERLVRLRHSREVSLEGQLVGLLDEGIRGSYSLGLNSQEMKDARSYLAKVYMNPYETHIENEDDVINKNYELLKSVINEDQLKDMPQKYFLPMSL